MSKPMSEKPPKIGVEIEANWPLLSNELTDIFTRVAQIAFNASSPMTAYDTFKGSLARASQLENYNTVTREFYRIAPKKYHFPFGWDKGSDSGVELRFDGPAQTLDEAKGLLKGGTDWLHAFGHNTFSGAGTHVHLGHVAWLDERFGKSGPIRERAEALLWGYFATRERAIFDIASPHRRTTGMCQPYFMNTTGTAVATHRTPRGDNVHLCTFDKNTPAWALHNHLLTHFSPHEYAPSGYDAALHGWYRHGGLQGCSICNRRKGLPTLEFRNFAGTREFTAVFGYVKLLYTMFLNAAEVLTEEACRAKKEDSLSATILVNPFNYSIAHFKKETDDPWLLKWIDETVKNRGEPISTQIEVPSEPQCVSAGA